MRYSIITLALLMTIFYPISVSAKIKASNLYIFLSQREEDIINKFYVYMKNFHKMTAEKAYDTKKGHYLIYKFKMPCMPETMFFVGTEPHKNKAGKIIECLISIEMFYKLPKNFQNKQSRSIILEFANTKMLEHEIPQQFISAENFIILRSYINVPSDKTPIPAEMVYNCLYKTAFNWSIYYKELQKKFKMPKEKIITKLPEEKKAK